jgi:hypothetical protein
MMTHKVYVCGTRRGIIPLGNFLFFFRDIKCGYSKIYGMEEVIEGTKGIMCSNVIGKVFL